MVDYAIAWDATQTLNMTKVDNNKTFTGTHAWKYNAPSSQPIFGNGTITPKNITFMVEPIDSLDYTGQELTPPVVVKGGTTTLMLDADYEVSYLGNTDAGTASVTVDTHYLFPSIAAIFKL